ncbi:hypothetical protein C1C98_10570 [Pseudomonas ogarae]|uniref:Uncharacterized protein n=1 Tax=Pseudomonas ogarae (strain DSM 112162 / CECT 30235 / F113) TaxID=1114970 RepID=A0ABN5GBM2_PSEO1|nr:hypothetical protein C1C98_10570 [Pseudomonas ogarae]
MAQGEVVWSYAEINAINIQAFVARELAPAGLRSMPRFLVDTKGLGPLRDPAGASSLATKAG